MKQEALTLLDLNALVRRSLEQCLPDEYWIQAELSDVRSNATGHCYLEFVQKDPRSNNLIAKARGTIWNNVYRLLTRSSASKTELSIWAPCIKAGNNSV